MSNEFTTGNIVFLKANLMNFESYNSILPLQIIRPDNSTYDLNYRD